jgi:hypothetical protein
MRVSMVVFDMSYAVVNARWEFDENQRAQSSRIIDDKITSAAQRTKQTDRSAFDPRG